MAGLSVTVGENCYSPLLYRGMLLLMGPFRAALPMLQQSQLVLSAYLQPI